MFAAELPDRAGGLQRGCQRRVRGQHEHDDDGVRGVRDGVPDADGCRDNVQQRRLRGEWGGVGWGGAFYLVFLIFLLLVVVDIWLLLLLLLLLVVVLTFCCCVV